MTYYEILGVQQNSNLDDIKKAYRTLAKQYHPDVANASCSPEAFLDLHEAYQTLSDPEARRNYDRNLPHCGSTAAPRQATRRRVTHEDDVISSLFEWLSEGVFLQGHFPRERKRFYLEVILTPAEARRGGPLILSPPLRQRCPRCQGVWHYAHGGCAECRGSGYVTGTIHVQHRIPDNVAHGMRERLLIAETDFPEFEIEVRYTISATF